MINTDTYAFPDQTRSSATSRTKVFVCYSPKDAGWLEQLRVYLRPLERNLIELWDYSKISIGAKWMEELQTAIQSSSIALLIVSANFLASDFIAEYELPKLLLGAAAGAVTLMPIIVAPCVLKGSGIEEFQAINPSGKPLSLMTTPEQEQVLVKLVETISWKLMI